MADIFVNDIGTSFRLTIKDQDGALVNLSNADVMQITFRRPDGTTFSRTASLYGVAANGVIQYVTADGDLDQEGRWSLQGYLEMDANKWHTSISNFRVKANL